MPSAVTTLQHACLVLTVFGRRGALRGVRSQVVARVRVLMHRREGVGPERGPRTAETRWVHGGMVVAGGPTPGLGPSLVEVVGCRVVVLAVGRRRSSSPYRIIRHPRVLLQLDEGGLVHASHTASGVRRRRAARRRRRILMRRRR